MLPASRRVDYRQLRQTAALFAVGFAIHGVDHAIRGFTPTPTPVIVAGNLQAVLVIVTVALVFTGHRLAPHAAIGIGLASAIGFSLAHLLPTWGWFSDSFVTPVADSGVSWFSWVSVFAEIGTALIFVYIANRTLRARRMANPQGAAVATT